MQGLASVYIDLTAAGEDVRAAVAALPLPNRVTHVAIDDRSISDMFGCRIAVDLFGAFQQGRESVAVAREYAQGLSDALGVPAFALFDLLRSGDCAH